MKTAAFIFGLVFTLAVTSFGQTTITNSTLQKFQQKRLAAERDYRENYQRLGFPSPEELEKQRETDMAARLELAEQLRQARLEKERLALEQRALDLDSARLDYEVTTGDQLGGYYGTYFGGFGGFGGFNGFDSRHRGRRIRGHFPFSGFNRGNRLLIPRDRGGYRVTPFGVIQTPNPQAPRAIFRSGPFRGRRR